MAVVRSIPQDSLEHIVEQMVDMSVPQVAGADEQRSENHAANCESAGSGNEPLDKLRTGTSSASSTQWRWSSPRSSRRPCRERNRSSRRSGDQALDSSMSVHLTRSLMCKV